MGSTTTKGEVGTRQTARAGNPGHLPKSDDRQTQVLSVFSHPEFTNVRGETATSLMPTGRQANVGPARDRGLQPSRGSGAVSLGSITRRVGRDIWLPNVLRVPLPIKPSQKKGKGCY